MLASDTRRTGRTSLARQVPAGQYELPSAVLSQQGGGMFIADPQDSEGIKTLSRIFQFDAALPESLQGAPFGSRVFVRFEHQPEPLGFQLYRRVRQLFLAQFDA
jgi:putative peptide zinc metalloprotease protein